MKLTEDEKKLELNAKPDWDAMSQEVLRKMKYLQHAWDIPSDFGHAIRRDLIIPNVRLLAEFCQNIEENASEVESGQE